MDSHALAVLGLDISKAKIDCALLLEGKFKSKVISNSREGFETLRAWLNKHGVRQVHAGCEATGVYWEAIALDLHEHGHRLSVVNPAQIAAYARVQLARSQTDPQDARLNARFCAREHPPLWTPPPAEERHLLALLRHLRDLQAMHQAEANRLGTAHAAVQPGIAQHLQFLQGQIETLKAAIDAHIDRHDHLRGRRDLLQSIPGLGEASIPWLMAFLGDGQRFERGKQAVAFVGLAPRRHESGSSVRGKARISRTGHTDLRQALYMPALVAYSRCAAFASFRQRLRAAGKPPKLIIVALMRKLLTIAQAILRSGQPFNPTLHAA